jgi:hypothetical protein
MRNHFLPPAIDVDKLRLAETADLKENLAFALRFEGKKPRHDADDYMSRIVADRWVKQLERAGYVVMKKPPLAGHPTIVGPPRPHDADGQSRRSKARVQPPQRH